MSQGVGEQGSTRLDRVRARVADGWWRLPRWIRVLVIVVAVFLAIRLVVAVVQRPTAIERAAETCEVGLNVHDDGHSMSIQLAEDDSIELGRWMSPERASCVFDALEVPSSTRDRLVNTRPLDGQQEDSWDDFSIRWWVAGDEAGVVI